MPKFIDLTGRRIGEWLVFRRLPNSGPSTIWECLCSSCGTIKAVRAAHLASGHSVSCGCLPVVRKHGHAIRKPRTHGQAAGQFSKKYRTWRQIKARCCNPNHKNADIYNGLLCDAWMSFEQFDRDVPDPPSDTHTIDRIKNSKGYEPGNVRWATMAEQHRNQSNCRWIEFDGRTQLLTDWAKEYGVTISTMSERIAKWGKPCGR